VIDTNVIISAILFRNSLPATTINLAKKLGTIILSEAIFAEIQNTLSRDKFNRYLSFDNRRKLLNKLLLDSELITITEEICVCRDEKDNKFLELAVSGKANLIITGGNDLLVLNPFRNIEIITVNGFLNRFS
jgi:putative PIN family toxin of toxin-antitoxin system